MSDRIYNVLFLCTGNSARSILAESALNHLGGEHFRAFSAGSQPRGEINPDALNLLKRIGYPTDGLRSKSWDEFAGTDGPKFDFIITVCDSAAGESCPIWPGHPMTAHWGIEDPSHVQGEDVERERAFVTALRYLENRIKLFTALPLTSLEGMALKNKLREIGETEGASKPPATAKAPGFG